MNASAKQAHRRLAGFIGLFLIVHFTAHFAAPFGIEAQDAAMQGGRAIYQFWLIEAALVAALMAQIGLGFVLLRGIARRKQKDAWHRVQFASALYLALFIIMHTSAAITTRLFVGLDTNFYWAAGTLVISPLKYRFAPYYLLAVTALFSHILAALHFRGPRAWHAPLLIIGPVAGAIIIAAYSGALYPVKLPDAHAQYFGDFAGVPPAQ